MVHASYLSQSVESIRGTYAEALESGRIRAVETGGCPHAAIREDISCNMTEVEVGDRSTAMYYSSKD